MSNISLIAAITRDGAIGRGGDMIHHISPDLKRFKSITMGHPVVMGRKTFESLPGGPLPGRRNIVVSHRADFSPQGVEVFASLDDALRAAAVGEGSDEIMVIGGGQIYSQAMSVASRLYITQLDTIADDADTFFPDIDPTVWRATDVGEQLVDPRTGIGYRFICYSRI